MRKAWVNAVTEGDKFSPMHFASFKGNINAVELLINQGGDVHQRNGFGLNMLHVAAQGDQSSSLYCFKKLNVDINAQDDKGSTPLHWACYSHSEIALSYILAWKPLLDKPDFEGQTCLHLAVKAVSMMKNVRLARFIMLRGADKDITDKKGKTASDLIKDIEDDDDDKLKNDLRVIMGPPGRMDCLMLSPPNRLTQKKPGCMLSYLLFFTTVTALKVLIVYARISPWCTIADMVFTFFTVFFLLLTSCTQPGHVQKVDKVDFYDLIRVLDSTQLCPDCECIRTSRSRHCAVCN